MSAPACIECYLLKISHTQALLSMLHKASRTQNIGYFNPHPFTADVIEGIAKQPGKDLYYVLMAYDICYGYGMLRGWNEGFDVPSLGILVNPDARGRGLGRLLMEFLHAAAAFQGASSVRLRVTDTNNCALNLYLSMGYIFANHSDTNGLLVGIKELRSQTP